METVVSPPVKPELNLLTTWGQPDDADRRRKALIATALFHVVGVSVLFLLPESFFQNKKPLPEPQKHITPIFEPLTPLTQKTPNTAKASKEFSVEERGSRLHPAVLPTPPAPAPVRASAPPPAPPPRKAVIPQPPPPKPVQNAQPLPEPPKVDTAVNAPKVDLPQMDTIPPPKIQAQEQPKLALQNLSPAAPPVIPPEQRRVPIPDTSVDGAIQRNIQGGPSRPPAPPTGTENSQSLQLPQLLSDAQGVDFTSYLRQILQAVKRNWQSVIPESVRLGRRGKVSVVLSIGRNGQIEKLVFNEQSGTDSLDKAAVAGVSMSQPFPPLPPEFRGEKIVVQFNFAYNAPKQ
ncbi:MAG: TonB family protein [Bryobacteraceae bacterium]